MQLRDVITPVVEVYFNTKIGEKKSKKIAHAVVERILKAINDGERVELPGLGVIRLGHLPAMQYTIRNTESGETTNVYTQNRNTLRFTAYRSVHKRLQFAKPFQKRPFVNNFGKRKCIIEKTQRVEDGR